MAPSPKSSFLPWTNVKRILSVVGAWWLIGVATGICLAPRPDIIGFIAGAIGGVIVTSAFGVISGLIGSRAYEILLAASTGAAIMAIAATIVAAHGSVLLIALGLLCGGLTGATYSSFLRFRGWIISLVSQHA